eukprot:3298373-Prymnesium_polylepis.2
MAEPIRVGSTMLCTQRVMDNADGPNCWFWRPPPVAAAACAAGRPSVSRRTADGVAAIAPGDAVGARTAQ